MKSFALTALLASVPVAFSALPDDVTVVPLPEACSSYPGYNADTDTAGPWNVKVVNSENPAIEGFSNTDVYSISFNPQTDRKPTLRWGHITFPTRNDIAHRAIRCSAGHLETYAPTDLTPAGAPTAVQWTPLILSPYPYDAGMMWKITDGSPIKPFEHYIDGVKQDGVFIGGYDNSTTWGLKWYAPSQGSSGLEYYYTRLLGPNSADPTTGEKLKPNETRGFIKIAA